MRNLLCKMAFAILRHWNASLSWDTAEVPNIFNPEWQGVVRFRFATMRMYRPRSARARLAGGEDDGENFVKVCPPNCEQE